MISSLENSLHFSPSAWYNTLPPWFTTRIRLDKLIKDHHKKCNQDDVYEYMINKNNKQLDNANEFEIDYDEFKGIVGEIICICQISHLL